MEKFNQKLHDRVNFDYDYTGLGVSMLSYTYDLTIGEVVQYINHNRTPKIEFDMAYIMGQEITI